MAMIERQVFDDGVQAGGGDMDYVGAGGGGDGGGSGSGSRLREPVEICAQCGTTPGAIISGGPNTFTSNISSLSTVNSSSKNSADTGAKDERRRSSNTTQRVHDSTPAAAVTAAASMIAPVPSRTSAAATARMSSHQQHAAPIRTESPMLGMRGGLEGPGSGAAEPIRGLVAFGSQSSMSASSRVNKSQGSAGGSSLSPRHSPSHHEPTPKACTCQQGAAAAGRAGSSGAGASFSSNSRRSGTGDNSSSKQSGARSNSPYRGGEGGGGGGGGGGTAATGGMASSNDPGYRVLEWSELSHLTYMTMGAMCEIHSAELDGVKVAVKIPRDDCEEPAVAEHDLEVELDVLKRVSHKHIIGLIGAGKRKEKPNRFLVLEFLELGTLADKLDLGSSPDGTTESTFMRRQKRTKRYQDFYMVTMLERSLELAMALEHLHHHMPETFVVHRDLKPDNVGFKADGTLKLFDFGLARVVKRRNRVNARYEMTGETGSMRYMAPEVVESLPYNEKVDVYAFGLLLWEMLEDRRVFDGMGVTDFYERVVNAGARPNLDPSWPTDLRKLISQCWHADVDRRPNFRAIAERLRNLYSSEKHSSKLCMSALNLNEDEHPKLGGGSSVNMLVRSATTTNVVGQRARGGGPSSQTEIGKKGGVLRRSFNKMGRMFNPKKGGVKATLTHTAPEAYSRSGGRIAEPGNAAGGMSRGRGAAEGSTDHRNGQSDKGEEAVYGDGRRGSDDNRGEIMTRRTQSDGMILKVNAGQRGR